jgi:hypothetical protein
VVVKMMKLKNRLSPVAVTALIFIVAGCIMSATFVVNETFSLDPADDYYAKRIDLTSDATWEDHEDEIQFIEAIGFELYTTSTEAENVIFNAYVDDATGPGPNMSSIPSGATKVVNNLTIAPGVNKVTYLQSLKVLTNLETLKEKVKKGIFDFYGTSSGSDGETFTIDSITVVVTLSAG